MEARGTNINIYIDMESPMKNMAYWKAKNAKSAPTKWVTLALGAAKAGMNAMQEHRAQKDEKELAAVNANSDAVKNMPKFG